MNGVVRDGRGGKHHLQTWQAWDSKHPFVKERPDLFAADPPDVILHGLQEQPVEQATAAPGEKRQTRRA
jgi:hypothetical protein